MKNQSSRWSGLSFLALLVALLIFPTCDIIKDTKDDPPGPSVELGDVLWVHDMAGRDSFFTVPALALDENRKQLYYAKAGGTIHWTAGRVVAVNTEDGTQVWESPAVDNINFNSDVIVGHDGTLYVIGAHRLYAINPLNGQFDWIWEVPEQLTGPEGNNQVYTYGALSQLVLASDGSLLLSSGAAGGAYYRALFNISPAGEMNWASTRLVYGDSVYGLFADADGRCYFMSTPYEKAAGGLHLTAVDIKTGAALWHTKIHSWGSGLNNIIPDGQGHLIVSVPLADGEPFRMHKVNAATGAVVASSTEEAYSGLKLMGPDGTIYQYQPGKVMRFSSGSLSASPYPGGLNVQIEGALINAKNQFVVIHNQGYTSHVNVYEQSGLLAWSGELPNLDTRRLILSSDGIYYGIVSGEGVFAMQGESRLSASGWPRIGHDNHNTSFYSN